MGLLPELLITRNGNTNNFYPGFEPGFSFLINSPVSVSFIFLNTFFTGLGSCSRLLHVIDLKKIYTYAKENFPPGTTSTRLVLLRNGAIAKYR
jgi:hypothetical protein